MIEEKYKRRKNMYNDSGAYENGATRTAGQNKTKSNNKINDLKIIVNCTLIPEETRNFAKIKLLYFFVELLGNKNPLLLRKKVLKEIMESDSESASLKKYASGLLSNLEL